MMLKEIMDRLSRMDELIRIKGTGSPKQLAGKIGLSERAMYETLMLMRGLGAPIHYCRSRQSYYYKEEGRFTIGFIPDPGE
jgi:predicted DNA-binding transcriptional regulator YafY